jgi:hypothetical protein
VISSLSDADAILGNQTSIRAEGDDLGSRHNH